MAHGFTVDAARALPGPDWLAGRRIDAAERLAEVTWPTAGEDLWRFSPIERFDPERFTPMPTRPVEWSGLDPSLVSKGVVVWDGSPQQLEAAEDVRHSQLGV